VLKRIGEMQWQRQCLYRKVAKQQNGMFICAARFIRAICSTTLKDVSKWLIQVLLGMCSKETSQLLVCKLDGLPCRGALTKQQIRPISPTAGSCTSGTRTEKPPWHLGHTKFREALCKLILSFSSTHLLHDWKFSSTFLYFLTVCRIWHMGECLQLLELKRVKEIGVKAFFTNIGGISSAASDAASDEFSDEL
jgi:hypothetical protein